MIIDVSNKKDTFKVSKNITVGMIRCHCGCGIARYSTLLIPLVEKLYDVKIPFDINSFFRCESHNKEVGGYPSSYHLIGCAVDIQAKIISQHDILSNEVRKIFKRYKIYSKDYVNYWNPFIHCQTEVRDT